MRVFCGVPQGSILGPLLFIIYINDLLNYLQEARVSLYADDTAMYYASDDYEDVILSLRIELSMVNEWLRANKLTLNVGKTKYSMFATAALQTEVTNDGLTINREPLEKV